MNGLLRFGSVESGRRVRVGSYNEPLHASFVWWCARWVREGGVVAGKAIAVVVVVLRIS